MADALRTESVWTRRINVPPALALLGRVVLAISAVLSLLFMVLIAALWVCYWLAPGPSARLTLSESVRSWPNPGPGSRIEVTDSVHARVPPHFEAKRIEFDAEPCLTYDAYVFDDLRDEYAGDLWVRVPMRDAPLDSWDPARLAASASALHREIRGPVRFSYSGFEVTAMVEATLSRSRHEGAYTVVALVMTHDGPIQVRSDNVTLGVAEGADPRTYATAAIDMLKLSQD